MTGDELEGRIVAVLSPLLGDSMAKGAVRSQRERLGLSPPFGTSEIDALLASIAKGLNVFVGKHRSAEVLEEMRQAVARK